MKLLTKRLCLERDFAEFFKFTVFCTWMCEDVTDCPFNCRLSQVTQPTLNRPFRDHLQTPVTSRWRSTLPCSPTPAGTPSTLLLRRSKTLKGNFLFLCPSLSEHLTQPGTDPCPVVPGTFLWPSPSLCPSSPSSTSSPMWPTTLFWMLVPYWPVMQWQW